MNQYLIQTSDVTKLISAKNADAAAKAFDPQCKTLRDLELKTERLVRDGATLNVRENGTVISWVRFDDPTLPKSTPEFDRW